jgi:hypothetical protein
LSAIVRAVTLALLAATLGAAPVFAETQCRTLKSRKDRDACHAQQASAKQARSEAPNGKMIDAIELLKIEDDRLAKRLQGICRGC